MKAFISALLAGAACAASYTKSWTGTKVKAGSNEFTPSGKTSWSGTASKLSVTWQQKVTMKAVLEKDDYAQSWTCFVDGSATECLFWQVKTPKASEWSIKFADYSQASKDKQTIAVTDNVKDKVFEVSGTKWTKKNNAEYTQKGDNKTATKVSSVTNKSSYIYKSGKINGKTFTGEVTREYDATKSTTIKNSGLTYSKASIGVFGKDNSASGTNKKGTVKAVTAGIAKKTTTTTNNKTTSSKTKNGAKKTWTGPKWSKDSTSVQAGGFTEWTKVTSGTTGTLTKYTCQTGVSSKAFEVGKDEAQIYLWDKTGKTAEIWQMKDDGMSYYYHTGVTQTETKDGESIKDQLGSKKGSGDLNIDGTGLKVKDLSGSFASGVSLNITKSKLGSDAKTFTACTQHVDAKAGTGKVKGSSKAYTQGVYYDADRSTKDGTRIEQAVTVQFAAESATSLLTTLGAVAFGVAALAF